MSPAAKVEGPSVVIACARIETLRSSPCRSAKRSETSTAAAAPQVGGQAIRRVITPGQITWSASTSSAVTSLRNTALGFFAAWREALARILAKLASGVPCLAMWLSPAPPK